MKCLILLLVLGPVFVRSQEFVLDLSQETMDVGELSYYVNEVRDETGVTDGHYGEVYIGMLNCRRLVAFEHSMEQNLVLPLLRNTADRSLPPASLLIRYLRLEEDHSHYLQRRELRIEAILELPGADGSPRQYGPRQVTRVASGMEVSGGHVRALVSALTELLQLFDTDLRNGAAVSSVAEERPAPGTRPEGVYYSLSDFRAGRVDTTLRLILGEQRVARVAEQAVFYEVDYRRPDSLARRDLRTLWGYHRGGTDYLYVEDRLLSLERDTAGQLFVAVPGGLQDPKASTVQGLKNVALIQGLGVASVFFTKSSDVHGNQELFLVDERSGGLHSPLAARATRGYLDSILLLNVSPPDQPALSVRFGEATYRIPSGSYVAVAGEGELVIGPDNKPQRVKLRQTIDQPTVYTLTYTGRGRAKVERGSTDNALATARSAAAGVLPRVK